MRYFTIILMLTFGPAAGCGGGTTPSFGYVELNGNDPLRHSWDFNRNAPGGTIQDNSIKNAGQHLDYGVYHVGEFSVGIQGSERGAIIDLGDDPTIAAELGVKQTAGGGQGFAGLVVSGGQFSISRANEILDRSISEQSDHAMVQMGHVYVVRIGDVLLPEAPELLIKLLVVKHQGQHVGFLWDHLN